MSSKPSVLVVAPTPKVAVTVFAWLADAGCAPFVVSSFAAAKQYLDKQPAVLISEVRLGEYNGLHLALRAQARNVPAVLLGHADAVLERDAAAFGAVYLAGPLEPQQLLGAIEPMLEAAVVDSSQSWDSEQPTVSFVSLSPRRRAVRMSHPFRA